MRLAALLALLVALPASANKPWYTGVVGTGAGTCSNCPVLTIEETQSVLGTSVANGGNVNRTLATVNDKDVVVVMLTHTRSSSGTAVIGTVTSPNLTFTQRVTAADGTPYGEARIYTAVRSGTALTNEVITATNTGATVTTYGISAVRLSGADSMALTTVGSSVAGSQVSTWSAAVTATGPNSYIFGCVQGDFNGTGTPTTSTPNPNNGTLTEVADLPDNANFNGHAFVRSTSKGQSGTRSVGGTWDGGSAFANVAAIEIKTAPYP